MRQQPPQKPGRSKQDFATPAVFLEPTKKLLGIERFTIDLAADASNAKADLFITKERDALTVDWAAELAGVGGGWGWLNPEFGDIRPWAKKCYETKLAGGSVAFLVPAGVGSNWFRDYVHRKAFVLALNGRIPFMPDKPKWGYPKDCILSLFSPLIPAGFDVWTWKDSAALIGVRGEPSQV